MSVAATPHGIVRSGAPVTQWRKCHSIHPTLSKTGRDLVYKEFGRPGSVKGGRPQFAGDGHLHQNWPVTASCPRGVNKAANTTIETSSLNMRADPSHMATPPAPGWKLKMAL